MRQAAYEQAMIRPTIAVLMIQIKTLTTAKTQKTMKKKISKMMVIVQGAILEAAHPDLVVLATKNVFLTTYTPLNIGGVFIYEPFALMYYLCGYLVA